MPRRTALSAVAALGAAVVAGCSPGGRGSTSATESASDDGVLTFAYGAGPSQFAELSLPPGTDRVPVVVVVHGGFWRTGYDLELGRPLAADLVGRGWAALNVEYRRVGRGSAGGGGWPQTGADVAAAVDALATQNALIADDRLDLTRVVGLGHSAGGQLVGWLGGRGTLPAGATGADPRVPLTGVVAQAGVMDLVGAAQVRLGGSAVSDLMGGSPARVPDAYAEASPLARLPLGVPSVCVHGSTDLTVPLQQSQVFVARATELGDSSELAQAPGDHFSPITVGSAAWDLCVAAIERMVKG